MDKCPRCLRTIDHTGSTESLSLFHIEGKPFCKSCSDNWVSLRKDLLDAWINEKMHATSPDHSYYGKLIRDIPQKDLKEIIERKKKNYRHVRDYGKELERRCLDDLKYQINHLEGYLYDNSSE